MVQRWKVLIPLADDPGLVLCIQMAVHNCHSSSFSFFSFRRSNTLILRHTNMFFKNLYSLNNRVILWQDIIVSGKKYLNLIIRVVKILKLLTLSYIPLSLTWNYFWLNLKRTGIELRAKCLPSMYEAHNNKNTFTKLLLHFFFCL